MVYEFLRVISFVFFVIFCFIMIEVNIWDYVILKDMMVFINFWLVYCNLVIWKDFDVFNFRCFLNDVGEVIDFKVFGGFLLFLGGC